MARDGPSRIEPQPGGGPPMVASGLVAPYIVLVGLDLSEPGGRAWRFAFDLAALKGEDSEVHAVVVGARALAPDIADLATPGVSTAQAAENERASRLPSLKVLEHRSAGGTARLMA